MKLFIKTCYIMLLVLLSLIGLLVFGVTTTPGLYALVKTGSIFIPGTVHINHVKGRLLDEFSIGELEYQNDATYIKISNLSGKWQLTSLLHSQLPVKRLNADWVQVKQDETTHTLNKIRLNGLLTKQLITLNSLQFNYEEHHVTGQLQITPLMPYPMTGTIRLNPDAKNKKLLQGLINIGGDLNQLHWTGTFSGPGEINLNGTLTDFAKLEFISKWRSVNWPLSADTAFISPEGRIKIEGTLPHLNLELHSKINQPPYENLQVRANVHGTIPWLWNFEVQITQPYDSKSIVEGLFTSVLMKGSLRDPQHGSLELTVQPGHYQLPKDSLIKTLPFKGGVINATLTPEQLSGKGSMAIDEYKNLNVNFRLPKIDLSQGLPPKQPVFANLSLVFNSFDFIQALTPEINNPKGSLTVSLKARGTLEKPVIETQLALKGGSFNLPALGLDLNAIDLNVVGKKNNWTANGSISSANKKLILNGQGALSPEINGKIAIQGTDFPVMNTQEYQINATPALNLEYKDSALNINGTILIPYAQIKPQTFSSSLALSDDVIFKRKEEKPATPFNTRMDIKLEMGNEVELTAKGLHAILAGKVHLIQMPMGPINATGQLNVTKGEYKAYGQDLSIEQGELIFTGGRIDNPGINVRATKKIDTSTSNVAGTNQLLDFNNNNLQNANVRGNISVGVEVSGRLSQPKIQLFSNPSILSQADILSMLVLGRPANQANKAGGQLLLAAISSMNLGGGTNGTQLLDQLKQKAGIDLNVQTNSNYNLATNQVSDNTSVVVGKSLSKRMYLSYNVGLSQSDPNVLTLKYLLNKFFSIQISNSTTSNGIDFLYTSTKK
ncbi:MAG: translocation/assembly module TamB domain-containing protein [Legionella sp.]|nr:translocation/assembly module TamB domain-containing protein [Legionella sp.]